MSVRALLICAIVALLVCADADARRSSSRRGGGGWGLGSRSSRTTPRPRPPPSHGSTPNKIGWNVPSSNSKPSSPNTAAKPSAPVPEHAAKATATNVQSGYSPSGGYPRPPASNPYHPSPNSNPSGGQPYNPSVGQGYNPSVGGQAHYPQSHNPSMGQPYSPPMGQPYNSPHGQPYNPHGQAYNPSYNQPYNPSYGQPHNPSFGQPSFGQPSFGQPQQTILMPVQGSRPGIGQLAKEAFVFAGVSAGVNAAVNRLLPGGIYGGSRSPSPGSGGGGSHTEITYNNYYNNGTAPAPGEQPANGAASGAASAATNTAAAGNTQNAPAAPAAPGQPAAEQTQAAQANSAPASNTQGSSDGKQNGNAQDAAQNNPNPLGYVISNDDIKKLTESLLSKDTNNANKFVTVNLQGQKKDDGTSDDASEPLLEVKSEAYEIPTIKALLKLHDNYELDVKTKETVTSEERNEESEMLDEMLKTDVIISTMKFLADKGYVPNDEYEFKDALRRIWFSQFKRVDGDASSSGFETVYLAEQFDSDIIGLHNWVYYAKQEADKKINYLGYIKEAKLGDKGAVIKVRSTVNGIVQPVTTIFVGTSPELELALYTICFFTRPNNVCPISLGGTELMIIANRVNYFGKDILISAYPDI